MELRTAACRRYGGVDLVGPGTLLAGCAIETRCAGVARGPACRQASGARFFRPCQPACGMHSGEEKPQAENRKGFTLTLRTGLRQAGRATRIKSLARRAPRLRGYLLA